MVHYARNHATPGATGAAKICLPGERPSGEHLAPTGESAPSQGHKLHTYTQLYVQLNMQLNVQLNMQLNVQPTLSLSRWYIPSKTISCSSSCVFRQYLFCLPSPMNKAATWKSHTAEAQRKWQCKSRYKENAAGKWVRCVGFREIDYDPEENDRLREFDSFDEAFAFEEECRVTGTGGRNARHYPKPKDTVPKVQLALEASLQHAIAADGNETRVQLADAEEHLHQRHDETQQQLATMCKQIDTLTERLNARPETCASVSENAMVRAANKKVLQTNLREITKLDKKAAETKLTGYTCKKMQSGDTFKILETMVGENGARHFALADKGAFDGYQIAARDAKAKGLHPPEGEIDTAIIEEKDFKADYEIVDSFIKGAVVRFIQDSKDGAPYRAGFYAKVLETEAGAAIVPVELTHQLEGARQPRHIKLKVPRSHLEICELIPDNLENAHPNEWCGREVKILGEALPPTLAKFAGLFGKIVDATTNKKTSVVRVRCLYAGSAKHADCVLPLPGGSGFDERTFDTLFQRSGTVLNAQKPKAKRPRTQKDSAPAGQRPATRGRTPSSAEDQKAHRDFVNALATDAQWKDVLKLMRKHLPYSKESHTSAEVLPEVLRIANDAKAKTMDAYEATFGDEQGKVLAKKAVETAFLKAVAEGSTQVAPAFQTWLDHLHEAASKSVPQDQVQFEKIPAEERAAAEQQADDASEASTIIEVESKEGSTKRRRVS